MKKVAQQKDVLSKAYNPEDFRNKGHELIDLLADYIGEVQEDPSQPVLSYQDPDQMYQLWQQDFESKGGLIDAFKKIISHSIHVHHPRYIGHQVAVPALVSSLAGLLSDTLNNGTGVYEMGMASNAMEKIVTDLVAKKIGYTPNSSGIITSGGSLANLTALLAARTSKAPNAVWDNGHEEKLAVMVSEEAHYCIDRAARILGMGAEGIIKIPVDANFKIRTDLLEQYYTAAKTKGYHVISIVGCACSTATGSYDDLNALADFANSNDLWFHVDGAHGGAVIFSEKYKHLVNGIERADSVVIDFHKMLMTPALNTALIFKDSKDAYQTFSQKAQYLWDSQYGQEWYNSGKRTFECTKQMMIIKVYALLKEYGIHVFEQNIDRLYDLAITFSELLKENKNFKILLQDSESNIINFRFIDSKKNLTSLNSLIREKLIASGSFYIVQTRIENELYLRVTIMNPLTTVHDLVDLIHEIERIAMDIK